ncbi:MAG TPA: DUF3489 domain-containing protein [Paracoccus solventivorans]|uniref:DUF3489 domain-containing protein n=1 Tax=Paracoccus solventivorans TaxID=53463 RepID=A0A832PLP7_9RHOB|nr:DUF3489 domain-containing protein [Paracoccus solventivorans]HHW32950.1 DUF3489 domain-containing protein [Paracoccus solventivorans]
MPDLTDTQSLILTAGSRRPGNLALPLPKGLAGAAAKMAVTKMIERGWLQEVDATPRRGEPLWREAGDGHGTTLVVTEEGLLAIGIDPVVASAVASMRKAKPKPDPVPTTEAAAPIPGRAGTKQAQIIAMLKRPDGATIAELVAATGWLAHTVRGSISGSLKKKLGLPITAEKVDGRGNVYRLEDKGD